MEKRYYYKSKTNKGFLNLKSPLNNKDYVEITKEEFDRLTYIESPAPTELEIKRNRINELKSKLAATDYKAIKYMEGFYTEEEYTSIKAERQSWRDEINELENSL